LLCVGLVVVVGVAIFYWGLSRPATRMSVVVGFGGYTNDVRGARIAVFTVTNLSNRTVWRWGGCRVESEGQAPSISMVSIGGAKLLKAGATEVVAFAAPTNFTSWRVMFLCAENDWRRKLFSFTGGGRNFPDAWRPALRCRASSEWIREPLEQAPSELPLR
jgi:hypothetical protein